MISGAIEKAATAAVTALVVTTIAYLSGNTAQSGASRRPSLNGTITFFVAEGDPRSGYRSSDRELASWAFASWARNGSGAFTPQSASESDALVRLYWVPPDASVFGEMRPLTVRGQQGAEVFVRADIDALGPDLAIRAQQDTLWRDTIVYLTCVHEIGHALGLEHTADFRDIMYFFGYGGNIVEYFGRYRRQLKSRTDITSISGLSDADVQRLRALHPVP